MPDHLHSNWQIADVLRQLTGVRRVDDGGDLLACRLADSDPARTAYIYLYGTDPDLIYYDLEDKSAPTSEWDHAVERGSVRSLVDLDSIVRRWLGAADSA